MEEIAAYQKWIDRITKVLQAAQSKRDDRKVRNLTLKANGGFNVLPRNVQRGQVSG